jgi:hypothetical protein
MKLPTGNLKKEWGGTFNLLYILGSGSKWQNNEIRYSIRSAEKYVGNLGRVFIVGEFPKFLSRKNKKITYIEVHDFTFQIEKCYTKTPYCCYEPRRTRKLYFNER